MIRVLLVGIVLGVLLCGAVDAQVSPGVAMAGLAAEVRGEPITRYELEEELADSRPCSLGQKFNASSDSWMERPSSSPNSSTDRGFEMGTATAPTTCRS